MEQDWSSALCYLRCVMSSGRNLAVDYSKAMVNVAQESSVRPIYLISSKIGILMQWLLDLPTGKETVTRIVSFSAIHSFPHHDKFKMVLIHCLAPGGKLFSLCWM